MSGKKTLILTEKREAGADLASTLGDKILGSDAEKLNTVAKSKGYLEGESYILAWAAGHLYAQVSPKEIDESYGLFKPFTSKEDYKMPKLKDQIFDKASTDQYKQRQIKTLKEILKRDDIKEIIIATDADEEGEAIGRDMLFKTVKKLPTENITRLWNTGSFKSKEAIDKAMSEREAYDNIKFERLYDTQKARSNGDYLVGMKVTKALVDTYRQKFYTGRVKGVVVSLIGNRVNEIENFKPKSFYSLVGKKEDVELKHFFYEETTDENGETKKIKQERYFNETAIQKIEESIKSASSTGKVIQYTKEKSITANRPLPLSGTDFASEMMGMYKISYKQCNEILDYLRAEGFTTYPGTNGRYFAKADEADVQKAFVAAKKYFEAGEANYTSSAQLFDDKKAAKQNHNPLHLTGKQPTQRDIEAWEQHSLKYVKQGFELIAKRILVSFLPDDEIEKQSLTVDIGGALFFASGQKAIQQGWRTLVGKEIKNTLFDFDLKEGDTFVLESLERKRGQTKKPALFTEKTLVDMMMNISKVVDEMIAEETDPAKIESLKRDRKLLKDAEGIGTTRTREQIIADLVNEKLITDTKEGLVLSNAGKALFDVLPPRLKDPIMTATWEQDFERIRRGEKNADQTLEEIDKIVMEEMIQQIIDHVREEYVMSENKSKKTDALCPLCGGELMETAKTFKCEHNHYKDGEQSGCLFSFFKDQSKHFGRVLSADDVAPILASTKENPYKDKGLGIYLDLESVYFVSTAFEPKEVKEGELQETPKTFRMNGKFVFKSVRYKNLTKAEAKKLLEGKTVELKRKTKDGKEYQILTKLSAENNGQVDTEMAVKG